MQALSPSDWAASWFLPWAQTPGFGGVAAVVAAMIAFAASRHQARLQRAAQRKEQWWKRAEWALNLTFNDDATRSEVGIALLEALASSEWAGEHEDDVIAAVIDHPITRPRGDLTISQLNSSSDGRRHGDQISTDTTADPSAD
ncbi:hypothetical protein N1027_06905 [Herbiconiux sp. CPCC 205763]|uniref:Uncharacterized protein n=1 Tax=Herbiconiux aconitum TaxID=2970913 RepID=A0ABT2GP23_9MICO|nr:hypothetical protein [Herbiconiux aconitum]MCS5717861.1 hypothetical protein [Herbiconiux aconitum]